MIRKVGNKWCLFSHKGKKLYCDVSRAKVLKRERQINYFKNKVLSSVKGDK